MGRNTQLNAYVGTLEELKDYVPKSRQLKVPEDSIYIYRTSVSDVFAWQKLNVACLLQCRQALACKTSCAGH